MSHLRDCCGCRKAAGHAIEHDVLERLDDAAPSAIEPPRLNVAPAPQRPVTRFDAEAADVVRWHAADGAVEDDRLELAFEVALHRQELGA
jgi:hypothetical protein